ncbi:MAG: succinate dehydrogenase cytochrome b subunit [Polyangiaceae bacterium]|nr:succinate dehydrogenase cytochrome b subunit [Polyangiaceae bacterium]
MNQALTFIDTTIGKKIVMALTGVVMFGFVLGHMAGNLQVFLGPDAYNAYAVGIHKLGPLLWLARGVLLLSLAMHIATAMQLVAQSAAARPVAYKVKKNNKTTFAALTMKYSGMWLLGVLLYHLAHFTFPGIAMGDYQHQHFSAVYTNVINGFSVPWVTALYIISMCFLGMHLFHGSYSLFQTVGLNNPLRNGTVKFIAQSFALLVTIGNILIPLSVLLGLVK